jgi:outer membrane protein assembly factor BamB
VPYTTPQALALVNNVLFVSCGGGYGSPGMTFAIDLASHRTVWSYPLAGELSVSGQGLLYIVGGARVAAINLK